MNSSKKIALEMEIKPVFREKCIIHKKKQFDENVHNEITRSTEESFKTDYFLYIVDKAISSIENRFEQFQIYEDIFSFLFNFTKLKSLDNDSLQKYYLKLEDFLKHDVYYDIDGLDLSSELNVLKEILQIKDYSPTDILNYVKRLNSYPNTCIANRILLIMPVTKKFFKIKINKIISKINNVPRKIKWISYIIN